MSFPNNYKYTKDHEWINIIGNNGVIGITDHAQHQLGDVVFVELPEIGRKYEKGDVYGVVESVKAVVDCYMPITGVVTKTNSTLESQADLINTHPHDEGWMVEIEIADLSELDGLMDCAAYEKYLAESAE